jgi:hypothetical protein
MTSSDSLTTGFFPLPFAGAFLAGALAAAVSFGAAAFFLGGGGSSDSKAESTASTSIIIESAEAPSESSARALPLPLPWFPSKEGSRQWWTGSRGKSGQTLVLAVFPDLACSAYSWSCFSLTLLTCECSK